MPTFSNSPIPREDPAKKVVPVPEAVDEPKAEDPAVYEPAVNPPVDPAETAAEPAAEPASPAEESPDESLSAEESDEITADQAAEEVAAESSAEATATEAVPAIESVQPPAAETPPAPRAAFRTTPDDGVIIRNFGAAQSEAIDKLNRDFGLTLDHHGFTRLQRLFRDTLKRSPTAGELRLLDALDKAGRGQPDREAVGELYTDSPAIAETWADMMDKHNLLHAAEGKKRVDDRPAPPCTFTDALTLVGRYLHRTGRVLPATDGLSAGGQRNSRRAAVLSRPWQEAVALAEGYTPVARTETDGVVRSVWVRKGPAPEIIPEKNGDFLVYLHDVPHTAMEALMKTEAGKPRSELGEIKAIADRSVLETVLSLCEGADLFADRLPIPHRMTRGRLDPVPLCVRPAPRHDGKADYLLRVPLKKVRNLSETLKDLGIAAVTVGQVKGGGKVSVRVRMENRDVPVAELPTSVLLTFPVMGLYRRRAEAVPTEESTATVPEASLWRVPEAGLLMTNTSITAAGMGQGYPAAIRALYAAVTPMLALEIPAHSLRLSVILTASDGEQAPGDLTVEALCGLYRAAAENGMAVEDPVFEVKPLQKGQEPSMTLTIAAWVGHPAALAREDIPVAPAPAVPKEVIPTNTTLKGTNAMNHVFEPLSVKPRTVILDTDIGPDCDDVGALVCLIDYAKKHGFPIAGICNCTSNKAGTGTIDAVCRHCGIETPYLGQWSGEGFQDEPACHKYNDAVAEKFSEAYRNGTLKTADEVTFYRTLLAKAEDDSVMIITIGMFNDLAALLRSGADEISPLSGMELVKAKVNCLVSMAAILPEGRECNVISDYKAAETVFNEWPTAVYLSDFHIGWKIMTGYEHIQDPAAIEAHPLAMAYHLYTKDWTHLPAKGMNSSYDLTAIQFAVEGEGKYYSLLDPVDLEFYAAIPEKPDLADATRAVPNPAGKFRFMKKEASDEVIRDSLNAILRSY